MNLTGLTLSLLGFCMTSLIGNAESTRLSGEEIVGGDDTLPGQYTYQISLESQGRSICGGCIVDASHVVTAAHCVVNNEYQFYGIPLRVVAGVNDLNATDSPTRVSVPVEKVYVPEEYNATTLYRRDTGDIAVLKLKEPLDLDSNPNLSAIELPKDKWHSYAGVEAVFTGFGVNLLELRLNLTTFKYVPVRKESYNKMRVAEANVVSNAECQTKYSLRIESTHLCAYAKQRDPDAPEGVCSGDSGGPLVHDDVLIGVLSTSPYDCKENSKPAVYTRVSFYADFIRKAVDDETSRGIRTKVLPNAV